ncbi:MAG: hypothetical protein ACOYN2_02165 [Patescibacteria group bacterium]
MTFLKFSWQALLTGVGVIAVLYGLLAWFLTQKLAGYSSMR